MASAKTDDDPRASVYTTCEAANVSHDHDFLYVPNFISVDEQREFLNHLYYPSETAKETLKWTTLRRRRLVNLGGSPDPKGMLPERIPAWVRTPMAERTEAYRGPGLWCSGVAPRGTSSSSLASSAQVVGAVLDDSTSPLVVNHVLINEYVTPSGIMPHEDGPLYRPIVAIVSMGSPAVLWFTRKVAADAPHMHCGTHDEECSDNNRSTSELPRALIVQPRSLLCFRGALYTDYLHAIRDVEVDDVPLDQCLNRDSILPQLDDAAHEDGRCTGDSTRDCARITLVSSSTFDGLRVPRGEKRVSVTLRQVKRVLKVSPSSIFGTARR